MEVCRCSWCEKNEIYIKYHDEEWGVPVHDDRVFFENLILESAQAGLNWLTILKKRENYRRAYENFEIEKVANYGKDKIEELMKNDGIIKNRLKIESSINNAKRFIEIQNEFGSFNNYIWRFTNGKIIDNKWKKIEKIPLSTELSDKIYKDMKKRGFKFLGSITVYSFLQATGIINDHIERCFKRKRASEYERKNINKRSS